MTDGFIRSQLELRDRWTQLPEEGSRATGQKGAAWSGRRTTQVEGDLIRSPARISRPFIPPLHTGPGPSSSRWLVVMHAPRVRVSRAAGGSTGVGGGRLCRRPRGRSLAAAQGGSRNSCSEASRTRSFARSGEGRGLKTSKEREEVGRRRRRYTLHSTES